MTDLVVDSRVYNLSTSSTSCTLLNGSWHSQCEYIIPNMIERDETIEYVLFSVPDAIIPVSMYNVNNNNNILVVLIGGSSYTYTFPYGNYNSSSFISQFNTLLGTGWSLTLNPMTHTFTMTGLVDFMLSNTSTIGSVVGFSSSVSSTSKVLVLPQCCNFFPIPRVCLRCPELANTVMVGQSTTVDIIATIPNNVGLNGQIFYQNQSQSTLLFRHHDLTRFIVTLTDDNGNLINFNGLSSYFTFQFDIYRKYVPKPPRFSNIVEYVNNKMSALYPDEEQPVVDNI